MQKRFKFHLEVAIAAEMNPSGDTLRETIVDAIFEADARRREDDLIGLNPGRQSVIEIAALSGMPVGGLPLNS